ncbi:MAG TPA: bifunctional 5,10-methylenetetrahydrofolate dehydrogenase/5,10-methenyltetrahydrofolate cyclohydrolase [Candidatus Dormibacteraeota bacterium]
MTAVRLSGKPVAEEVLGEVEAGVRKLVEAGRQRPHLAVVLVGSDPASETYVRGKHRDAERVGIDSADHRLSQTATTEEVVALIQRLNADPVVTGVLVQQPLPPQVDVAACVEAVDPAKDVDGFHPVNAGRLLLGQPGLRPCTPAGVIRMLDAAGIALEGAHATVVGRSNIVGKPVALLLLERHATITVCHSRTPDVGAECRRAEVLVVAIGRPHFVTADMVKPGAAVVDVGITPGEGGPRGDVDPAVAGVAGWLTPVPGGVGLMTRAMLMRNTLLAAQARSRP